MVFSSFLFFRVLLPAQIGESTRREREAAIGAECHFFGTSFGRLARVRESAEGSPSLWPAQNHEKSVSRSFCQDSLGKFVPGGPFGTNCQT